VEIRQLEYFAAIARHRNFGRAAEELYVTQSALSQQIRRLEDELGLQLLRRTRTGADLTPAGTDLLEHAQVVLAELARARARMDDHAGLRRGAVRLATTPADALRLPEALATFHRVHPGIQIALRQGPQAEVVDLVRRGVVDLAVVSLSQGDLDALAGAVDATALPADPLRVILPPGDALARDGVSLWALRERAFVLPERGSALREAVMAACAAAGFSPVPRFEVGDPATVRFLVHSGLGVGVVPASWLTLAGPDVAAQTPADDVLAPRPTLLRPAAEGSPAARLAHAHLAANGD